MTHAILIQNRVQAQNIDALNRSVICASAIDNGNVFYMGGLYDQDGYKEVFEVKQPTTGSVTGLWMAYSPEVVLTDGAYKGIDPDPRSFVNSASQVFDAFKPVPGDIITLTTDALDSTTKADFAVSAITDFKLKWASAPSGSLLSLKHLEETSVPVGSGSAIGTHRVTAHKFEVLSN